MNRTRCTTGLKKSEMIEESEKSSNVGFYLLPRVEREPSPPSPHQLLHRLSIIKEVSEDSSTASTPISSPNRRDLWQNEIEDINFHKESRQESKKQIQHRIPKTILHSNFGVPGEIENMTYQQEIVIHTSGRGDGYTNQSSQR